MFILHYLLDNVMHHIVTIYMSIKNQIQILLVLEKFCIQYDHMSTP